MRRLYSIFAGGWPGIGLLLMRLVIGAVVLWHVGPQLSSGPPLHMVPGYALLALGGLLLIAGLWTPVAGVMVAAVAMSEVLTGGEPPVGRLLAATIAAALAMLGPGRLSLDARLFGWKRIDEPMRKKTIRPPLSSKHVARKGPARHPAKSSRVTRASRSSPPPESSPPTLPSRRDHAL